MTPFDYEDEKYHLGHFIINSLKSRPDAICQIDAATGESETNASVLRRSIQFARCLRQFGTQPGDVLALGGINHLDLHIPYYAALINGMPIAGVDPLFKYNEIKCHFKVSSPRVAFCQKEHLEDYLLVIKELELNTEVICFDDEQYSMKKFIVQYDDLKEDEELAWKRTLSALQTKVICRASRSTHKADQRSSHYKTAQLVAQYPNLDIFHDTRGKISKYEYIHKFLNGITEPLEFNLDQIYAWLVSTGGTTGVLKLAAFKHKMIINKILQLKAIFKSKETTNENIPVLNLSPVQWISGFFSAVCFPFLRQTKISSSAVPTVEHILDVINKYKPQSATMAPSLASAIIKSEKKCDWSCFSNIVLTGSKIHKDIHLELRKRLRPNAMVLEAYGQTESLGPVLVPNPAGPIGNCGVCVPGWENIKLVDPDTGKDVTEPNVFGEMWIKAGPLSEYYKNPEETASTITSDGWYMTGDILYKDDGGNYFFVERLKMMIKCRGYLVIPSTLEAVIREHPDVQDVSVTSILHDEDGDRPVACVVRKKGATITAQEIKDIVNSKLSESQQLRGGVVFMDELPLTSTNKVARGKLRQMVSTARRE